MFDKGIRGSLWLIYSSKWAIQTSNKKKLGSSRKYDLVADASRSFQNAQARNLNMPKVG